MNGSNHIYNKILEDNCVSLHLLRRNLRGCTIAVQKPVIGRLLTLREWQSPALQGLPFSVVFFFNSPSLMVLSSLCTAARFLWRRAGGSLLLIYLFSVLYVQQEKMAFPGGVTKGIFSIRTHAEIICLERKLFSTLYSKLF